MPPPLSPPSCAAVALQARRYGLLASPAAERVATPVVLHTSAPLLAPERGSELVATVSFAPASCGFIAATAGLRRRARGISGSSLTLACSEANQALEGLAPLPRVTGSTTGMEHRRNRTAYEQDVHFAEALRRVGELAGA